MRDGFEGAVAGQGRWEQGRAQWPGWGQIEYWGGPRKRLELTGKGVLAGRGRRRWDATDALISGEGPGTDGWSQGEERLRKGCRCSGRWWNGGNAVGAEGSGRERSEEKGWRWGDIQENRTCASAGRRMSGSDQRRWLGGLFPCGCQSLLADGNCCQ